MAKKISLAELMGGSASSQGSDMQLSKLHEILGASMPELPRNAIGRHRLVRSLSQRFGKNFRSLPGVSGLVSQFDNEIAFEKQIQQLKNVKLRR